MLSPSLAAEEFRLPADRVWLNASHQGPLPVRAARAVEEMVKWKMEPHHLQTPESFTDGQERLRATLARLVGAPPTQIALANSASYGLYLVANGLQLQAGDEVIVVANDFPSDILPWVRLEEEGAIVRRASPRGSALTADEVSASITARTKVLCLTWVHSLSGVRIDIDGIGDVCRTRDVLFVVNGSQGVGAIPIGVADHPIDVLVSVGHKWLVGPYGSGFVWLGERAMERVSVLKLYWKTALTIEDLAESDLDLDAVLSRGVTTDASRYAVFATSNLFNFAALLASAGLVEEIGVENIHQHNLELARQLTDSIDPTQFEISDRGDRSRPASIVFSRPLKSSLAEVGDHLEKNGIDIGRRSGQIRAAIHFYNTQADIARFVGALDGVRVI
jgi:cysteine desulfurase/selenocysteine lyase